MAWRKLRGNKSNSSGDVHIGLGVSSQITPDHGEAGGLYDRLVAWGGYGGRLAEGKATRERQERGSAEGEWWNWLSEWCTKGRSITVWGWGIGRALVLLDIAARVESGELLLQWQTKPRKRKDGTTPEPRIERGLLVLDDPPTIVQVRHRYGNRIEFRDCRNYFRHSSTEMAEHLQCFEPFTAGVDDDYSAHFHSALNWAELAYATGHAMVTMVRGHDLGMLRSTIAGQAMAAFRHRGMKHEIVYHDVRRVQELERESYFGGQTEVFFRGKITAPTEHDMSAASPKERPWSKIVFGQVFRYDVNGFFPHVMQTGRFPTKLEQFGNADMRLTPEQMHLDANCIAEVILETQSPRYPVRHGGFTYYPVGKFVTVLAGPELLAAIKNGHAKLVGRWSRYQTAPIFESWIAEVYEMRRTAKCCGLYVEQMFWKNIANCLYGKFAQLTPEWVDAPDFDSGKPWGSTTTLDQTTGATNEYRSICWRTQRRTERGPKESSLIAIAAFVTAAARNRMYEIRSSMPDKSVYYQGIDSLHVNRTGAQWLDEAGLVAPDVLGFFKLEGEANSAQYFGRADYQFGSERVFAGAKAEAHWEGQRYFTQSTYDKLDVALVRGPGGGVRVQSLTLRGGDSYRYGAQAPDGWVYPLAFPLADQSSNPSDCTPSCAAIDATATASSPEIG